ncbi:hypothetical protein HZS55_15830 [Halosimplex rubrum]|uniref:Uncharacterized protein n=1 Tax=Halosimplex rubrum TaxID=869889 RepID=A0A7D5P1Q9_9EURY|nr:hypothetical protein [Halosimplex rubrum]QLH78666.1 hypothetical protein HZS55_15830 [Halosimplex rubrum]
MKRDRQDFKRDLPAPPTRSQDNYASALAEVYRTLDEAELVAPGADEREWVGEIREQVRGELIHVIEDEDGE